MTIKSIDAQMALQRSSTLVQEAQHALKRNELNQDFLAVKNRIDATKQELQVRELEEKEKAHLNPDKEREDKKHEAAGQESETRKESSDTKALDDNLAILVEKGLVSKNKIDITI